MAREEGPSVNQEPQPLVKKIGLHCFLHTHGPTLENLLGCQPHALKGELERRGRPMTNLKPCLSRPGRSIALRQS